VERSGKVVRVTFVADDFGTERTIALRLRKAEQFCTALQSRAHSGGKAV
jgi:hypothetical protein